MDHCYGLHTAGHLPIEEDGNIRKGKVGQDVSVEDAYDAARLVTMNLLATLKSKVERNWTKNYPVYYYGCEQALFPTYGFAEEAGSLNNIKRIVKLTGFVNCVDGFAQQPQVINGASDFIAEVFGEKGVHSRSAVGTNALPLNIPVEIEAIVELEP